jgi:ABC-type transport system involved in multi-copper enzyme maturation permease subunit
MRGPLWILLRALRDARALSWQRIWAIARKELRDYRRNTSVTVTMAILPIIFVAQPLIEVFSLHASSADTLREAKPLLYMLGIPALVPALMASYAIVGERLQGALEPVLTTPLRREELLVGKALAALAPALIVSYTVFALSVGAIELFADPTVASAVVRAPEVIAQIVFTPLLATWSIWVGIAISVRCADSRAAGQLSLLASLPAVAIAVLISVNVIHASLTLAIVFGAVLLVLDLVGWRVVSPMLDRERLITGTKST